ncbi:chemotaxis protein CheX [Jeotgalibacillus aurantiacus]|uniref:chemotaxis protein CheX n=1 Tax=Jeotgalibacillus aurantiacus TaxID=2763266 RepID=UPI001D09E75B|nr:chemotaxis protein CheX [Jeotgalibacillus aurantiacus]
MTITKVMNEMLEGMVHSIKSVIPAEISCSTPEMVDQPYKQETIGVLIGITGDIRGNILLDAKESHFSSLGNTMFGMHLEDEMLISFIGEVGNMIAGAFSTFVSGTGVEMDITPPSVMSGTTKLYGFNDAIHLPFSAAGIGDFSILVSVTQS